MSYEDLNDDFTATFTSLSIMRKKKEEIIRMLMNRKIESMGSIRGAAARAQLEKAHETEIKEKAKEIMNSAILCFEAFTKDNSTQPICSPLFSGPIFSQKRLKIHHLSHYSGSWKGGETIILLCDKVEKGKVRVQFYEDDEGCQWEENAKFNPADVHYQVAIKFETPPFRGNIEKEVNVCLIQDGEKSNSVQFLYKSDKKDLVSPSKKRKWNTLNLESEILSTHQSTFLENTPSPSSSSNDYSSDNHMEQRPSFDSLNYSHMPQFYSINSNATAVNIEENQSLYPASLEEIPVSIPDINGMDMQSGTECTDLLKFLEDELSEDLANERDNPENSISFAFSMLTEPVPEYVPDGPTKSHLGMSFTHEMLSAEMLVEQCMSNLTLEGRGKTWSVTSPGLKCMKHNRTSNNLKDKEIYFKLMCMRDESDNSLLHKAVLENKGVRKLLELSKIINYDIVNVGNCNKKTPVHIATEKNDYGILGLLLKYGGNCNLKDENGNGCLHIAAENGYANCLKEIFSHGCHPDVNAFNYQGLTPLHISVMKGFLACVEFLIKYADVNEKDKKSGRSPLHFAVDMQPFLLPTLLRKCDISVNVQDFGGNTPLHLASVSAHVDCVKQLLEAGADPWIRNFKNDYHVSDQNSDDETTTDGETAMDVAESLEIIELLQKAIEKTCSSIQSDSLDDTSLLLDPVAEEKLCSLLDPEKYRSLAECIGMDICLISQLIKLNPSPTRQILKYLKMQYEDQYIDVLKNSLEIAGLDEALKIIKERQH